MKTEELKKLKQLDRIEYLLRENDIFGFEYLSHQIIYPLAAIIFFLLTIGIGAKAYAALTGDLELFHVSIKMAKILYGLMIFLIIILVPYDIWKLVDCIKEKKKLDDEFFEVKAK